MRSVVKYIAERLAEPTTWRGVFLLLTAGGATFAPELQDAIITVGLGVVGALGVATPDPQRGAE